MFYYKDRGNCMSIVETRKGDLLDAFKNGDVQVIVHGCNCFRSFGAGIAKSIKERYLAAYEADLQTSHGDKNKLGTYSYAILNDKLIINAYTQYAYGRNKVNADYNAIRSVFKKLEIDYGTSNKTFGIPLIGAGLAGGDWSIIKTIINEEAPSLNIILYVL